MNHTKRFSESLGKHQLIWLLCHCSAWYSSHNILLTLHVRHTLCKLAIWPIVSMLTSDYPSSLITPYEVPFVDFQDFRMRFPGSLAICSHTLWMGKIAEQKGKMEKLVSSSSLTFNSSVSLLLLLGLSNSPSSLGVYPTVKKLQFNLLLLSWKVVIFGADPQSVSNKELWNWSKSSLKWY